MKRVFEGHFAVGVGGRSGSGDELLFHRWPTLGIDFRCFVADPSVLLRRRDCMPTRTRTRSGGVLREASYGPARWPVQHSCHWVSANLRLSH